MPQKEQFAANLAMMFSDSPFLERFARAAAAGFAQVEISTPELFSVSPTDAGAALRCDRRGCVGLERSGLRGAPGMPGDGMS